MFTKVTAFLKECEELGLDCYVFESYRSQERQDELYAQGRTTPGKKVTWTLESKHKQRKAVDMAFGGPGKWSWSGEWYKLIEIAKNHGLDSLAPREMAHLQDNGKEHNPDTMKYDETDYVKIMEDEVEKTIFSSHEGEDSLTEANIKALIEIAVERKVKSIIKQLS